MVPAATEGYVKLICSQGANVTFQTFPGITHALAADASIPELIPWLTAVNSGHTPRNTC